MSNHTWIPTPQGVVGVISFVFLWVYGRLVTDPLYIFWRKGKLVGWGNLPDPQLCSLLANQKFESEDWKVNPFMEQKCKSIIMNDFESWDATLMTVLYFTVLIFSVLYLFCNCFVVRPIIRAVRN